MAIDPTPTNQVMDPSAGDTNQVVNWFADSSAQYPMRPLTSVTPLVCGEEAFAAVARALRGARETIDICFWGLDPAMLLERGTKDGFDKDVILGELLLRKAIDEDVKVRIIVWDSYFNSIGSGSGGSSDPTDADKGGNTTNLARFRRFAMQHDNIEVCMTNSYGTIVNGIAPSFHQKSIIVDIENASRATAFVMGHNMVVSYWSKKSLREVSSQRQFYLQMTDDTRYLSEAMARAQSILDNQAGLGAEERGRIERQQETIQSQIDTFGGYRFRYEAHSAPQLKPYFDISTQVWGTAVVDVYANFARVWSLNKGSVLPAPAGLPVSAYRPRSPRTSAQIAATFPLDGVRDIEKLYFNALCNADRYILMVNQYFRNWPLTEDVIEWRDKNRESPFKAPMMVVTNNWNINWGNFYSPGSQLQAGHDGVTFKKFTDSKAPISMGIMKTQEPGGHSEVYVHAKLLIVDDVFYTIGSANYNTRGMFSDPELNVGVMQPVEARRLRQEVMNILIGDPMNEFESAATSMAGFVKWNKYVEANSRQSEIPDVALPHGRVVAYDAQTRLQGLGTINRLAGQPADTGSNLG